MHYSKVNVDSHQTDHIIRNHDFDNVPKMLQALMARIQESSSWLFFLGLLVGETMLLTLIDRREGY